MNRLKVVRDRRSYTVTFGYWSFDPDKAAALSSSLLAAYTDLESERKRSAIVRTTGWLDERVATLRVQAQKADDAVEALMKRSGLIDTGAETSLDNQLVTLSAQYAQAKSHAIDTSTRAALLKRMQASHTLDTAPDVLASIPIQRLKETYGMAMSKIGTLMSETRSMSAQITAEENKIVSAAVVEASQARERASLLEKELAAVRSTLTARNEAKLRLDVLQRDAKANHSVLEDSLVRLNGQTALAREISPDVQVMAKPEPPLQASFPNPLLFGIAVFLAACIGGATLALRLYVASTGGVPTAWRGVFSAQPS